MEWLAVGGIERRDRQIIQIFEGKNVVNQVFVDKEFNKIYKFMVYIMERLLW